MNPIFFLLNSYYTANLKWKKEDKLFGTNSDGKKNKYSKEYFSKDNSNSKNCRKSIVPQDKLISRKKEGSFDLKFAISEYDDTLNFSVLHFQDDNMMEFTEDIILSDEIAVAKIIPGNQQTTSNIKNYKVHEISTDDTSNLIGLGTSSENNYINNHSRSFYSNNLKSSKINKTSLGYCRDEKSEISTSTKLQENIFKNKISKNYISRLSNKILSQMGLIISLCVYFDTLNERINNFFIYRNENYTDSDFIIQSDASAQNIPTKFSEYEIQEQVGSENQFETTDLDENTPPIMKDMIFNDMSLNFVLLNMFKFEKTTTVSVYKLANMIYKITSLLDSYVSKYQGDFLKKSQCSTLCYGEIKKSKEKTWTRKKGFRENIVSLFSEKNHQLDYEHKPLFKNNKSFSMCDLSKRKINDRPKKEKHSLYLETYNTKNEDGFRVNLSTDFIKYLKDNRDFFPDSDISVLRNHTDIEEALFSLANCNIFRKEDSIIDKFEFQKKNHSSINLTEIENESSTKSHRNLFRRLDKKMHKREFFFSLKNHTVQEHEDSENGSKISQEDHGSLKKSLKKRMGSLFKDQRNQSAFYRSRSDEELNKNISKSQFYYEISTEKDDYSKFINEFCFQDSDINFDNIIANNSSQISNNDSSLPQESDILLIMSLAFTRISNLTDTLFLSSCIIFNILSTMFDDKKTFEGDTKHNIENLLHKNYSLLKDIEIYIEQTYEILEFKNYEMAYSKQIFSIFESIDSSLARIVLTNKNLQILQQTISSFYNIDHE